MRWKSRVRFLGAKNERGATEGRIGQVVVVVVVVVVVGVAVGVAVVVGVGVAVAVVVAVAVGVVVGVAVAVAMTTRRAWFDYPPHEPRHPAQDTLFHALHDYRTAKACTMKHATARARKRALELIAMIKGRV